MALAILTQEVESLAKEQRMAVYSQQAVQTGATGQRFKGIVLVLGIMLVSQIFLGCGAVARTNPPAALPDGMMAVVPFTNHTAHPNAGLIVADTMRNELLQNDAQVVSGELTTAALRADVGQVVPIAEIAKRTQAQIVVSGAVYEYGYKNGLGEEPVVSISVQIYDAAGKQLWSGAVADAGQHGFFRDDSLGRQTLLVCERIVRDMQP